MSSFSFSSINPHSRETICALKELLRYESYNNKTLLHQLNIKIDSIECDNQKSKTSNEPCMNYNNSYEPLEIDNLSALYAQYQIDPHIYPPPDLQLYDTIQKFSYLSHPYLQPSSFPNNSFSEQRKNNNINSNRTFRNQRKKQKRLKSNKTNTKQHNKLLETNSFHHRNIITVRQISCQDMLDPQIIMKKRFEYDQNNLNNKKIKNKWNEKTRSTNLVENKLQKYKHFSTEFNSSPPLIELHTSPIQSTMNKLSVSPSITNSSTKSLTTPDSNLIFQQKKLEKQISNSMSRPALKFISLHDSSASSLASTQLLDTIYNQTQPDINTMTNIIPDSQIDFRSLTDSSPHLSPIPSSIVPHFSSTIAPHVSSSTTPMPNVLQPESNIAPNSTSEDIQNLIDQLKTCITTLNILLQNKSHHKKHIIPNVKSYSNKKRSKTKKKQSQLLSSSSSPSLTSTPDHFKFLKSSISNTNDLVFKDITVRQCNSFNDQEQKKHQSNILASYNDQHKELKRCLLVYFRDRGNNINSNEKHRYSSGIQNHLMLNQHLSSSQSFQSISNNSTHDLSISKSNLILSEEDDEYESFNELLKNIVSLK